MSDASGAQTFDAGSRDSFIAACRAGHYYRASSVARGLLADNGGGRMLSFIASQVAKSKACFENVTSARIAVLSSYSADFLRDALTVACFLRGLIPEIYQSGFNQFRQEILDPDSELYRFSPDTAIVSVLGEALCPALYETMPDGTSAHVIGVSSEIEALVAAFRGRCSAALIIQGLLPPVNPLLGVGDASFPYGQRAQVRLINAELARMSREQRGIFLLDYEALVGRYGATTWHDERMRHFAQLPINKRVFFSLADEYAKIINILKGGAKKCIVVDLDNTLWGGILGEDGIAGVQLDSVYPGSAYKAFQRSLAALTDRGILLGIASKNNPTDVDEVFEKHPHMVLSKEHFAAIQVGWQAKSESIKAIAKQLDIGLEHIVLIDDSPAECAEVSQVLPMVRTLLLPRQPENFPDVLAEGGLFDALLVSVEDRGRTQLYKQRNEAESLRESARNLDEFYRSLDMGIRIEPVSASTLARAAQLTQKTNQLNFTTYRYTEADIQLRLTDRAWHCCTVSVIDRFGDHGIVGLMMTHLDDNRMNLDTFLLSCRVIGRSVETAMLAYLCDFATRRDVSYLDALLIRSAKNVPARSILPDHGFEQIVAQDDTTQWRLDIVTHHIRWPDWFRVLGGETTVNDTTSRST